MSQLSAEWELRPVTRASRVVRPRVVRIGLLGYGRIGQAFAELVLAERRRFVAAGLDLRCVSALVRDIVKPRGGPALPVFTDLTAAWRGRIDLVVEALGGVEPAATFVAAALRAGVPVVTANKSLVAAHGEGLRALARAQGTSFAFDAAVVAGVPFLGSLTRRPVIASARRIEGVLNGTSHFIVTELGRGASFQGALDAAIARGYAEPDSTADVTGQDAAEKLAILLQIAGCRGAAASALPRLGIDVLDSEDLAAARRLGGTIKPVVTAALDSSQPGAWVGPAFLPHAHPFTRLDGVENALRLTSANGHVVTFSGPGAGPRVTAETMLDDALEMLEFGAGRIGPGLAATSAVMAGDLEEAPSGEWWLRLAGPHSITVPDLAELLATRRVAALQVLDAFERLVVRTAVASPAAVREIVRILEASGARVLALPVLPGGRDA